MNITKTTLKVGLSAPLTLLHVSDTHLTRADGRDDERKLKLAKARREKSFPDNEEIYAETLRLAEGGYDAVLHTGDFMDFVSYANIDVAREFANKTNCFFAAGNHDFSLYVGEAKEDAAYRAQSFDRVNAAFQNHIRFDSREIGGVNLVAVDNSYYLFEEFQLEGIKKEVEKGLPIILLMHNPIYERSLYEYRMKYDSSAGIVGVPEELMAGYPQYRFEQQRADEVTLEMVELIKNEPLIKAILCGHIHCDFESELRPGLPQLCCGKHSAREIYLV